MNDVVIHPEGTLGGFALCRTLGNSTPPWWARPHCPTCTCTGPDTRLEHGTWVTCGYCGRTGILPDEGHEADFMPPWVVIAPAASAL